MSFFLSKVCFLVSCVKFWVPFSTVQERLTKQIASAISEALDPAGVAVVIEAVWVFSFYFTPVRPVTRDFAILLSQN